MTERRQGPGDRRPMPDTASPDGGAVPPGAFRAQVPISPDTPPAPVPPVPPLPEPPPIEDPPPGDPDGPAPGEAPPAGDPRVDPPIRMRPGAAAQAAVEIGGPSGPEPTRYGDWERKGRVSDF